MNFQNFKRALAGFAAYKVYKSFFPTKVNDVAGKLCLITGAASGVGRVLAIEMAKKGARLVLWDVQEKGLKETMELVLKEAPRTDVKYSLVNLADPASIKASAAPLREDDFVEIIVNNAGIVSGTLLGDIPDEKIELTFRVNVISHFYVVREFLPAMIKRNTGHIATVASMAALLGASGMTDYASSKFAARGFCEALALELYEQGHNGIHVSCICPTLIDTGLFKGFHVPGSPTLQAIDVANAVIDSIEYNKELVCCPDYLKYSIFIFKSMLQLDHNLSIKLPLQSPMKNFDNSQASRIFDAMQSHAKL